MLVEQPEDVLQLSNVQSRTSAARQAVLVRRPRAHGPVSARLGLPARDQAVPPPSAPTSTARPARQQRRTAGHLGHDHVLVVGVGAAAHRAQPVERRAADPGGEVAVGGAAHRDPLERAAAPVRRRSGGPSANSPAEEDGSSGGRFGPPMTSSRVPASRGVSARISCRPLLGGELVTRTSTAAAAPSAGTVLGWSRRQHGRGDRGGALGELPAIAITW